MFRSNQLGTADGIPSVGNAEQFRDGGGPAFINNVFQGTSAALLGAQDSHGKFTPGNARLGATFTGDPGSATRRRCSRCPGQPTAPRCTSGRTALGWTAWTCPPSAPSRARPEPRCRPAAISSSCSSLSTCRPRTCSPGCASRRPRSSCRSSSWPARPTTTAWSGSSPRPGGRTSWSRPGGTGPSRWSSWRAGSPAGRHSRSKPAGTSGGSDSAGSNGSSGSGSGASNGSGSSGPGGSGNGHGDSGSGHHRHDGGSGGRPGSG